MGDVGLSEGRDYERKGCIRNEGMRWGETELMKADKGLL
jgi:hypothetical protein